MSSPRVALETRSDGRRIAVLEGVWTLAVLGPAVAATQEKLAAAGGASPLGWDLTRIGGLDTVGATLLWRQWGGKLPPDLALTPAQAQLFEQIGQALKRAAPKPVPRSPLAWLLAPGGFVLDFLGNVADITTLVGRVVLDVGHLLRFPRAIPWREISANLYRGGVLAMPVSALVGFLIGVVLSYLSALQLRSVGAEIYIVNLLGIGIVRELGPVLVAVLVAGRSGSAMTAQLGVMRVTEEIDALATMGISRTVRLIVPKIVALAIAMPLLVLWTNAVALVGGMVAAAVQLDISYGFFIEQLPRVVPIGNVWIGLAKGFAFGIIIAVIACHFGLRVRPNTESLSAFTTTSVVTSITAVILVDAIFAIATRQIGIPS